MDANKLYLVTYYIYSMNYYLEKKAPNAGEYFDCLPCDTFCVVAPTPKQAAFMAKAAFIHKQCGNGFNTVRKAMEEMPEDQWAYDVSEINDTLIHRVRPKAKVSIVSSMTVINNDWRDDIPLRTGQYQSNSPVKGFVRKTALKPRIVAATINSTQPVFQIDYSHIEDRMITALIARNPMLR